MSTPEIHVQRFARGSRVPGWDERQTSTRTRPGSPNRRRRRVPDELRQTIEAAMARYPDRHSAVIPALWAAQERYGWCSPEAVEQGRLRAARDARLRDRGGDLLRHVRAAPGRPQPHLRLHEHLLLAVRRRRAVRGLPGRGR